MILKKMNLSEQAYLELTGRIVDGRYPAGTRLTEETLAGELGISRTPLREALRRLASEGLIEALPKRGLRVVSPDAGEVAELFECRSIVEPQALVTALARIPEAELRELRLRLDSGDVRESLAVDESMHELLAEYCGNRFLREIVLNLIRRSAPFRTLRNYATPEVPLAERIALLDAMLKRDLPEASELLKRHHLGMVNKK